MTPQVERVHPLRALSENEILKASAIAKRIFQEKINDAQKEIRFKHITLSEPPKSFLMPYLDAESDGVSVSERSFVPRCAHVIYSVPGEPGFTDSIISLDTESEVTSVVSKEGDHTGFDRYVHKSSS